MKKILRAFLLAALVVAPLASDAQFASLWNSSKPTPNWAWRASDLSLAPYVGSGTPTVARALNTATRINSSGLVETVNANLPRFDYNTAGVFQGLLIEPTATNIVLQNNNLPNSAWTKGVTATAAKDQTGPDGVANSASKLTGGAVTATNTCLQTVTLASSSRVFSAWLKRITGTGTIEMTTDGGTTWVDVTSSITASWGRISIPPQTVTNPNFGFRITTNGDAIGVGFVQNETGLLTSSTTQVDGTAVTRNFDYVSVPTSSISGYNGNTQGSMYSRSRSSQATAPAALFSVVGGLRADTSNNISIFRNENGSQHDVFLEAANVIQAQFAVGNDTGATQKMMFAWATNNISGVKDGGAVASDLSATIPTFSTMTIGNLHNSTNNAWSGWINDVELYPVRLNDAAIQALTQ